MAAHRMTREHMGRRRFAHPVRPERGEIVDPDAEILDMAGDMILAKSAGSGLPAPIGGRHPPARAVPLLERFEIFLIKVAAPGKEQDRALRRLPRTRPVDAAQEVPVGRLPAAFAGIAGDGAAVDLCGRCQGDDLSLRLWLLFGKS
jgi:hypothetical protein